MKPPLASNKVKKLPIILKINLFIFSFQLTEKVEDTVDHIKI